MNRMSFEQLDQVRQDTNALVPGYFINELNPHSSLENGVGNCFAKAMVAAGIIVTRHNIEPSTFYSKRLHGTDRPSPNKPVDRITKKNMAHIALLVPAAGASETPGVLGVSFGRGIVKEDYRQKDTGQIMTYDDYARVGGDGIIVPTEDATDTGMTVRSWREGADEYLDVLDRGRVDLDSLVDQVRERLEQTIS